MVAEATPEVVNPAAAVAQAAVVGQAEGEAQAAVVVALIHLPRQPIRVRALTAVGAATGWTGKDRLRGVPRELTA